MQDEQIIDLYFARAERAISETDIKYGRYCMTIANNILHSSEDSEECKTTSPIQEFETLEKAEKASGIEISVPESVGAFTERSFSVIAGDMIEVTYYGKNGNEGLCIRKTPGTDDPSGAYYTFDTMFSAKVGNRNVTMSGVTRDKTAHIYKAVWTDGKYAYSVMAPFDLDDESSAAQEGFTQAEMEEIIKNVK